MAIASGLDLDKWPNVKAWWARVNGRPAVRRGTNVPKPPRFTNEAFQKLVSENPEGAEMENGLKDALERARQEYNYVYKSP